MSLQTGSEVGPRLPAFGFSVRIVSVVMQQAIAIVSHSITVGTVTYINRLVNRTDLKSVRLPSRLRGSQMIAFSEAIRVPSRFVPASRTSYLPGPSCLVAGPFPVEVWATPANVQRLQSSRLVVPTSRIPASWLKVFVFARAPGRFLG